MFRTLDDIYNSLANMFCGESGRAGQRDTRQKPRVVRLIGWEAAIKPVDLQVFVGLSLEPSLRKKFDVL